MIKLNEEIIDVLKLQYNLDISITSCVGSKIGYELDVIDKFGNKIYTTFYHTINYNDIDIYNNLTNKFIMDLLLLLGVNKLQSNSILKK